MHAFPEIPDLSVPRARDEAVDLDVNDIINHPGWGVPDLRHRAVCWIRLGPAAANVIDDRRGGDIVPLCADPHLIAASPVRLFDGRPFIVTQNVPVGSPATYNFRYRLNLAFPPVVLGTIPIDAGRRQGQSRCRQHGKDHGGESHDHTPAATVCPGRARKPSALNIAIADAQRLTSAMDWSIGDIASSLRIAPERLGRRRDQVAQVTTMRACAKQFVSSPATESATATEQLPKKAQFCETIIHYARGSIAHHPAVLALGVARSWCARVAPRRAMGRTTSRLQKRLRSCNDTDLHQGRRRKPSSLPPVSET
jgi:hypothetical protein